MKYIELFAGCGGLSLGLKSVKGTMLLANELSPMAGQTFAYNLLNEDLDREAIAGAEVPKPLKTKWLRSRFPLVEMKSRLRENPQEYPVDGSGHCDLPSDGVGLLGSLIIGSVVDLNLWLTDAKNKAALDLLKNGFGKGNVDLVSGGPPCQSFSMAGMRDYSNSRNVLPWEFAKFVELVQPKFALLENVTGILRPFEVEGQKKYAWFEVAQAFAQVGLNTSPALQGYVPICLHINAKYVGVAQSRPRFIMLAIRYDVYKVLLSLANEQDKTLLISSQGFFEKIRNAEIVNRSELPVHDVEKNAVIFKGTFLEKLRGCRPPSVKSAIDDLRSSGITPSKYVDEINRTLGGMLKGNPKANHELRKHSIEVESRFRIYQVLSKVSVESAANARKILKGKEVWLSSAAWRELREYKFYVTEGRPFRQFTRKCDLELFLAEHATKKHSQKALIAKEPAPAALSIPDDTCHYHEDVSTLRTLTVREMARIQSFPDRFTFRSKATTGGPQRKYEVPQYTQVGNAVPPLLGQALGEIISELLKRYESSSLSLDRFKAA